MAEFNVAKYYNLTQKSYFDKLGKVSKIVGLTIESIGPDAKLNDLCVIHSADNESHLYAEVVGFKDSRVLLMPFDNVDGIVPGCIVENTEKPLAVKVGDAILGHTLDGLGNPMNGEELGLTEEYSVEAQPPYPYHANNAGLPSSCADSVRSIHPQSRLLCQASVHWTTSSYTRR